VSHRTPTSRKPPASPAATGPRGAPAAGLACSAAGAQRSRLRRFGAAGPDFPCGPPDLFLCGDDEDAKRAVTALSAELGWPTTADIGGIEGARLLEPLCILWVVYGFRTGGWDHAVKMLRKSG